jgi:antitoxin (DNA-binding transcriptional repressor) of toxin-antitoxin stability system
MLHTVSLNDLRRNTAQELELLLQHIGAGDEILVMNDEKPLATIRPADKPQASFNSAATPAKPVTVRHLGLFPNLVTHIADDFDEPLSDFQDYMRPR